MLHLGNVQDKDIVDMEGW